MNALPATSSEALRRTADADDSATQDGDALAQRQDAPAELRIASGLIGLTALRSDWMSLAQSLDDARFFHRHAWQLSYLDNLERDPSTLHVFAFYRHDRPVGIFPLRYVRRTIAGLPLRVWELPCEPHMDLCDVLIARDQDGAALLGQLLPALALRRLPWDALHLPKLLDGSIALNALHAARPSFVGLERTGQSMHFRCDAIESAQRHTCPQFARNLRRQRRKLDSYGPTEVAIVREPDEMDAALADFLRIEASGWKGAGGSAIALHPHVEAFYRNLVQRFATERRCAINLLKLKGSAIAAHFCLIDNRRMNLLKIAYDETYAAEAPGHRLLHDVLTWCSESNEIDELSLVTGPTWTAGRWNPQTLDVWSACIFNISPRGLAAYMAMRMKPLAAAARATGS